ncbi:MerR family transcriptional regulator [Tsuneonella mangrovi]|uniref:MerR family transcriptional regulator n=1 Tax=Tsuneonella mangrovi TaxID=1982042 RepID=UPI000BA23572|nr:MerR family transcriptional regulator [Tsuneonella mangrovi]
MIGEFDDGKDAGALRTIGEVGEALGIKPHVLRYWEQQFPMLDPLKRSGGRRYYRPDDVELVRQIDRLVNVEGYTIKGAVTLLKESPPTASSMPARQAAKPDIDASTPDIPEADSREIAPEPVTKTAVEASGASISPEIIARLRQIRATLAAAVAA